MLTEGGRRRPDIDVSWSDRLMDSLDRRSAMLETACGNVQIGRAGKGPVVLVIHGGPGGFDQGLAWASHLIHAGCQVVAPSRPGYLRTPLHSGLRPDQQADLYAAALDALALDRVAVLGFSSGGASAVHFAARHPDRTTALLLDTAILLPYEPPIGALQRMTFESTPFVWLACLAAIRRPALMTRYAIDGVTAGLSKSEKRAATTWITADPMRLRSLQEQFVSAAPPRSRRAGWNNDQANERGLAPLPFRDVAAPTLVAHGTSDAVVPLAHAKAAAARTPGAELMPVERGHHFLSLSPGYGPVARRQLDLIRGPATDQISP